MVDLPNTEAANLSASEEPYYLTGVYGDVPKRRSRNVLGRTRTLVDVMLALDPYSLEGLFAHVEVYSWQFGGRG